MSAPPFDVVYAPEARTKLEDMQANPQHALKVKKTCKALRLLSDPGPSYPGLNSHLYQSVRGPNGEPVWESYVENRTPSAWRIWWIYGPEADQITVATIGPHPD